MIVRKEKNITGKAALKELRYFHDTQNLLKTLNFYSKNLNLLASDFSKVVLGKNMESNTPDDNSNSVTYAASLRTFLDDILHASPIIISEKFRSLLYQYINVDTADSKQRLQQKWIPDERIDKLTDTKWYIYHYDEREIDGVVQKGIVKSYLTIKLFARIEIETFAPGKDNPEKYVGRFSFFKQQFLLLELRLKNEKDLQILLHIGNSEGIPNLAIGRFTNSFTKMYGGRTLIERARNDSFPMRYEPKFYVEEHDSTLKRPKIHKEIWRFFSDPVKSFFTLPLGVSSLENLKKINDRTR